jgi:hypothetical protein
MIMIKSKSKSKIKIKIKIRIRSMSKIRSMIRSMIMTFYSSNNSFGISLSLRRSIFAPMAVSFCSKRS